MSSARRGYAPLPNPTSDADADRELEAAFGGADSDGEDDDEHTPLQPSVASTSAVPVPVASTSAASASTSAIPGAYDFERADYDRPPPGSPPGPSAHALPNSIGNSNGVTGTAPAVPAGPRPGVLRRTLGALLPQHYTPLPAAAVRAAPANDGVFGNVTAKPARGVAVTDSDGSVYVVPEHTQVEQPPSYQSAQADSVPPYYDVSVSAPDAGSDMVIDDLPTGSLLIFALNAFISFFFQFVGFLMTYIMHTSHAAKFGSRAGLGLTLIQYGVYTQRASQEALEALQSGAGAIMYEGPDGIARVDDANATDAWGRPAGAGMSMGMGNSSAWLQGLDDAPVPLTPEQVARVAATRAWLAFLAVGLGAALLLFALHGFWRVKRWERSVRTAAGAPSGPGLRVRAREALVAFRSWRARRRDRAQVDVEEEATPMVPVTPETQEQRLINALRGAYII